MRRYWLIMLMVSVALFGLAPGTTGFDFNRKITIENEEYVSLLDFSSEIGAAYQYDPMLKKISIDADNHHFTVFLDRNVFVIDNQEIISGPGTLNHHGGQFYLNLASARYLAGLFSKNKTIAAKTVTASEVPVPPSAVPTAQPNAPTAPARKPVNSDNKLRINTICLDPGHGGDDAGAINPVQFQEKNLTLKMALMVRQELRALLPDMNIIMTRESDVTVPLQLRPTFASSKKTNLYVSIHANSAPMGNKRWNENGGLESYIFSMEASDAEAAALAEQENASLGTTEELSQRELVLFDLRLSGNTRESSILANYVHNRLVASLPMVDRGIKRARFYVLKKMVVHDTPSILLELGFLCNRNDYQIMQKETYYELGSQAIATGIKTYIDEYNQRYLIGE